jgi:phage/plasmid-associated DNA primase
MSRIDLVVDTAEVVGGDDVLMEKKYAEPINAGFTGVVWFTMNEAPAFGGDRGKHVFERLMMIRCGKPVPPERQDKRLLDKLYTERQGIVYICLMAAREVVARGYRYAVPEASQQEINAYVLDTSSVKTFLDECCTFSGLDAPKENLHLGTPVMDGYARWCKANGYKPVSRRAFVREAADFYGVSPKDFIIHKMDGNYYPLRFYSITGRADELATLDD